MNRLVGLLFCWIFFFLFLIFFPNVTSVAEQDSNYWWFFLCSWLLGTGSGGVGGWCCSYTIGLNSFSCVNICKQQTRRGERKNNQHYLRNRDTLETTVMTLSTRGNPQLPPRWCLVRMLSWLQGMQMEQSSLGEDGKWSLSRGKATWRAEGWAPAGFAVCNTGCAVRSHPCYVP